MTVISLPNRPTSADPRVIADVLADFDAITTAVNAGLQSENIADRTVTSAHFDETVLDTLGINTGANPNRRAQASASNEISNATHTFASAGLSVTVDMPASNAAFAYLEVEYKAGGIPIPTGYMQLRDGTGIEIWRQSKSQAMQLQTSYTWYRTGLIPLFGLGSGLRTINLYFALVYNPGTTGDRVYLRNRRLLVWGKGL